MDYMELCRHVSRCNVKQKNCQTANIVVLFWSNLKWQRRMLLWSNNYTTLFFYHPKGTIYDSAMVSFYFRGYQKKIIVIQWHGYALHLFIFSHCVFSPTSLGCKGVT